MRFVNLRTSEIHLFYNLQLFYWHFLEILWLFIFLVLYFYSNKNKWKINTRFQMNRKCQIEKCPPYKKLCWSNFYLLFFMEIGSWASCRCTSFLSLPLLSDLFLFERNKNKPKKEEGKVVCWNSFQQCTTFLYSISSLSSPQLLDAFLS